MAELFSVAAYRQAVTRWRQTYAFEPLDHLVRREFYIWGEAIEKWRRDQGMPAEPDPAILFNYDPGPFVRLVDVGWCEPPFIPPFQEEVVETTGEYEICRDRAGRLVRYFKGQRHGFMPTYLQHSVASRKDWENVVKPRLDPRDPRRYEVLQSPRAAEVKGQLQRGERLLDAGAIGGYMYLRALVGPEEILFLFYDDPGLVHDMMATWRDLCLEAFTRTQDAVGPFFQFFLGEDICFNHGPLIGPEMIREFILPYYREVYQTLARRQSEHLYFQIDTDGFADPVIPLYREVGMDVMSPFEVASNCDVVRTAKQYPDLVITGGIDKRILASGRDAIDRELDRIIPFMVKRGGYIPTCDHGVPDNVAYADYLHYRERMCQLDH